VRLLSAQTETSVNIFNPSIVLTEHDFYPRCTEKSQPTYQLEYESWKKTIIGLLPYIHPGTEQLLNISININDNYEESTFVMAFQLKGSVISSDAKNKFIFRR
jgi:hypothetical protein